MCSKDLLLLACLLLLLGGLRLTSTTTTTTFVAAMSIANQDLDRYFRTANATQILAATEDRILIDFYHYAYLNYTYHDEQGREQKVSFVEEKARYGEGLVTHREGPLVHVSSVENTKDDTACTSTILGTNGSSFPKRPWIALVRRGLCTFEEKVKHVYEHGAMGVIIYNDKPVNNLEKMQIKDQSRKITAVITYLEIGLEMARIVDQGLDVEVAIILGRTGSRPLNSLNKTSVLFVSISFIVLMVISLVWLLFYYIQRFRYLQTKDQQSRQLCSVTKKAIMKIPTKTGKSSDEKDLDSDCCAICIEAYKPADCIRVLPCKHEFHKNCIDPWLIEHRTCPMCKLDVLKFYGFVFLGSEESILEYEPDRPPAEANALATVATNDSHNAASPSGVQRVGALGDLMRSRDFVIDFPRIFVLDAGGVTGTHESLFPSRLPERSQSSISLAHAKDWMSAMTNKLDEQHGLRRLRRGVAPDGMDENLLTVCAEPVKKRRSRSADGRYSSSHQARQQAMQMQSALECGYGGEEALAADTSASDGNTLRPNSTILDLTDTVYARSRLHQRQENSLELPQDYEAGTVHARRRSIRRSSEADIQLHDLSYGTAVISRRGSAASSRESTPPLDVAITIQVNGEGIDLE